MINEGLTKMTNNSIYTQHDNELIDTAPYSKTKTNITSNTFSGHIGILGGTFNPVHNGHRELARMALEKFALDRLLIMPNNIPGYKDYDSSISNHHRLEMLGLATAGMDKVTVSDIEIKRSGVTYTVDTLRQLHGLYPDVAWHFIMGGDSIINFKKWREPDSILRLASLIVTTRDDISTEAVEKAVEELKILVPHANIDIMKIHAVDVSSSEIRRMVQAGESIYGMTPDSVVEYIYKNHLYINV
jgi:nicotinate-nucleotide adenylyltransferase